MANVFYLPSSGSAAVSPTPDAADWDHVNNVSRPLEIIPGGSAFASVTYTPDAADDLTDKESMVAQFVSQILPPQTLVASLPSVYVRAAEAVATNNLFLAAKLYATNVAGSSVLATLAGLTHHGTELGTTNNGFALQLTVASVTLNAPWRLVLELGFGGTPTASASVDGHNGNIEFGSVSSPNLIQNGDNSQGTPFLLWYGGDILTSFAVESAYELGI